MLIVAASAAPASEECQRWRLIRCRAEPGGLPTLKKGARPGTEEELDILFRIPIHGAGDLEETMGRGLLLWLIGVPIPVIILLWLFFGH